MDIFSAHFFPTIRYLSDWINAENPVLDNCENYQKQSYRTRCHILSPNGKQTLTVPTQRNNKSRRMKDIKISYAENWQKEHFKSLEAAYRSSPYFEYYEYIFNDIYQSKSTFLFDLNHNILERLLKILNQSNGINVTNQYYSDANNDFREKYHPKKGTIDIPKYPQVFEEKMEFVTDLSIIDLLCNKGPESIIYLKNLKK